MGEASTYQEGDAPQLHGDETPVLRTLPDLDLCVSSSGCSSVSFIISFNKLINVSVSLSSVSLFSESKGEEVVGISHV